MAKIETRIAVDRDKLMSNGLPDVEVTLVVRVVERSPRAVVGPLRKMRQDEDLGGSCHTPLLSARQSLCNQVISFIKHTITNVPCSPFLISCTS